MFWFTRFFFQTTSTKYVRVSVSVCDCVWMLKYSPAGNFNLYFIEKGVERAQKMLKTFSFFFLQNQKMYSGSLPGSPKPPYTILPSIERKKKNKIIPGKFSNWNGI